MTEDKFMLEFYLKQPGFSYSVCGPFTKLRERIQKFRETGNLKHFYRIELDKACFTNDAEYFESKDLLKRTTSYKILTYTAYEIERNRGYNGYQRTLASMVYKFLDKRTGVGARATGKVGINVNQQLAEELYKLVTKKFKRRKVYERFKDNICEADCLLRIKMLNIYYVS